MRMFGQGTKEGGQTSQLRDEGVDVVDERRGIQSLINISRSSGREAEILDFENFQFLPPLQRGSFRTIRDNPLFLW